MEISVVLSIYNANLGHLKESIDSILNQSIREIEFIIVLNAPENKEVIGLVESYSKLDDRIVLLYNDTLLEIADSYNKGIAKAKGKYIALTSADDICFENRLKNQLNFMKTNNIDLSGTDVIYIDDNSKEISKRRQPKGMALIKIMPFISMLNFSSTMFKKEAFDSIQGFRDILVEDRDLYLRFISSGYKVDNLSEYLVKYRFSDYQTSGKNRYERRLVGQYVRKLHIERLNKNTNTDSFSMDNLKKFVAKHNGYNQNMIEKYNESYINYLEGLDVVKNNKIKGILKIIKSIMVCPSILYNIKVGFITYFYKRKYKQEDV